MAIVTGLILLGIGLLACFFGWRLFRLIIGLQGFVIGYFLVHQFLAAQGDAIALIVGIVAGIVLFFLFYQYLYNFAFVVIGIILGLMIAAVVITAFSMSGLIAVVVAIVLAVIGAIVGNMLSDLMIRLGTAFSGASQAIGGLAALASAIGIALPLADPTAGGANTQSAAGIIALVAVIVLGVVGYLFQTQSQAASS